MFCGLESMFKNEQLILYSEPASQVLSSQELFWVQGPSVPGINETYDMDHFEEISLSGDRAACIKTGLAVIDKSR